MRTVDIIATEITSFLVARGDRIATEGGVLTFHSVNGALIAELNGETFYVVIHVRPE